MRSLNRKSQELLPTPHLRGIGGRWDRALPAMELFLRRRYLGFLAFKEPPCFFSDCRGSERASWGSGFQAPSGRTPAPSPARFPARPAGGARAQAPGPTGHRRFFTCALIGEKCLRARRRGEAACRSGVLCPSAPSWSRRRRQPNAAPGWGAQPDGRLQGGAWRGPRQPDLRV